MTITIGFTLILMLLFAGYMSYKLIKRRTVPVLISLSLEVFALTIAMIAFIFNVQTTSLVECLYISLGVLIPAGFFLHDYIITVKKVREHGLEDDLFDNKAKAGYTGVSAVAHFNDSEDSFQATTGDDIFNQIESISPNDYKSYYDLAVSYCQMGLREEAIECFKRVIEIQPDNCEAYYSMAIALDEIGNPDDAIRAYKKAIRINPGHIDAYNNLGILLSTQGKHDEAIYEYSKGLEKNPSEYSLYFNMGVILAETGRLNDAVEVYKKALDKKPEEYEISYHLGAALIRLKRYDEAIEAYKCALKSKPSDSELFYNLSVVYSLLRRHDIAMDNLKKAIDINSELKAEAKKNKAFDSIKSNEEFKKLVS